ncbi:MAG: hypothetical protein HAW62_05900 [Endozoicomonadaceae bacterium]|nr:hypothetical protein [Endozoicomonadaceae bacterium]
MQAMLVESLTGFLSTMGLKNYPIADTSMLELDFEEVGLFKIEDLDEGVAFYLAKPVEQYHMPDILQRALSLCHYYANPLFDIQCALLNQEKLIFLHWCPHDQLSVPKIESILMYLTFVHEKVFNG